MWIWYIHGSTVYRYMYLHGLDNLKGCNKAGGGQGAGRGDGLFLPLRLPLPHPPITNSLS